jgi:tetratricopeptide (TPR) repeat protein
MKSSAWTARIALSTLLVLTLGTGLPAGAQDAPEQTPEQKKEAKRKAKDARIEEYLRQKEERRARREQEQKEQQAMREATEEESRREQEAALALQEQQERDEALAGAAAAAAATTTAAEADRKGDQTADDPGPLPKELARAQQNVRRTSLGEDPTVQSYLELVDRQAASPQQLGAMGNFLAEAGMTKDALAYYDVALRLDPGDSVLWINLGTLQRQLGNFSAAASAYGKALGIDPNQAAAHYNLAASYDALGKYDQAIEEYKIALRLDPSLGDPAVNPQAANNRSLTAVQLLLYQEQIGAVGLPMLDVPGGEVAAENETSD